MIDHSTRWPEAVPLGHIDVDTVLEAFITKWVACFGVPARITTDRGTQFTSGTWGDWCQKQGVQHITTTAYHPQANGMVERIHCTLKADKYRGPYKLLERGNKAWKIQVGERVDVVSKDCLKPHLGTVAPKAAVPPRCGRPRTASVVSVASTSVAAEPGGPVLRSPG